MTFKLTPVQNCNGLWLKRDDLFKPFGLDSVNGGKLRQCFSLVNSIKNDYKRVISFCSIHSPQAPITSAVAKHLYNHFPYDGKYILTDDKLIICQSNATNEEIDKEVLCDQVKIINPLGEWTGGKDVDTGATNRKLGSDMAQSVTGGGLHGKDLSKADVSVNIYAFKKAQETGEVVSLCCAIGDDKIDGKPYSEIVKIAREYINKVGGFEKFAEWGLY